MLFDEALPLIGRQGGRHVDRGHSGGCGDLLDLSSHARQGSLLRIALERQDKATATEREFTHVVGVSQEVRQRSCVCERRYLHFPERKNLLQVRADGHIERSHEAL